MNSRHLLPALATAAALVFSACERGHDHDHDHGHDHGHAHEDAEQPAPPAETGETAAPSPAAAGKETAASDAVKPYPLETCIVGGSKLGSMGEPVVLVHEGQEVKFCCESCQPKFKADPAKYLAKLSAAKN